MEKQPVTTESIAWFVGQRMEVKHSFQEDFNDLLQKSIHRMVYGRAIKYSTTCKGNTVDDLAQICWQRIISKLHLYNPEKSKFTTWSWYVCDSILGKTWVKRKRYNNNFAELHEEFDYSFVEGRQSNDILRKDILTLISDIVKEYPQYETFLVELVGDPKSGNISFRWDVKEAAQKANLEVNTAYRVVGKILRPRFKKHFAKG